MTAKDIFEGKVDIELKELGVWSTPMRSVVSALYVLADNFMTLLNLLLLKGPMARLRKAGAPLVDLPAIAGELLDEIVSATALQWLTEELPIFGKVIENPSLRIDGAKLADIHHKIFIGEAA